MDKVDLAAAFARITEHWRPRVVAELNGQEVKLAKLRGEFVWHHHADAGELFLVVRGACRSNEHELSAGDGVAIRQEAGLTLVSSGACEVMLFDLA